MDIILNGLKLNYEIEGQGENLLVLHGWGGCIDSVRPIINHYKDRFKVISIDFPGHGKSECPSTAWGVEDYMNFLNQFLNSQSIDKTHIISHSFGGRVSILLSSKNPSLVSKMVLVDSGGIRPKRNIKYYLKVYTYKFLKQFLKIILFNSSTYENVLKTTRKKFGSSDYQKLNDNMRSSFIKIVNQDLTPYLKEIKCETLLVWGENDYDTPLYMAKKMNKEIENSGLVILNDAGHFSYLDKSYQFNLIVDSFLEGK